jgi:hypothetical protein
VRGVPRSGLDHEESFRRLFAERNRHVLAYALRRCEQRADAEDVVAGAFAVAWLRRSRIHGRQHRDPDFRSQRPDDVGDRGNVDSRPDAALGTRRLGDDSRYAWPVPADPAASHQSSIEPVAGRTDVTVRGSYDAAPLKAIAESILDRSRS